MKTKALTQRWKRYSTQDLTFSEGCEDVPHKNKGPHQTKVQ
jgi:hypothetical protein